MYPVIYYIILYFSDIVEYYLMCTILFIILYDIYLKIYYFYVTTHYLGLALFNHNNNFTQRKWLVLTQSFVRKFVARERVVQTWPIHSSLFD